MKCAKCNRAEAPIHPQFGPTWCKECINGMESWKPVHFEFTPQYIKDERVKFLKSQIQSHRSGELSKEWIEAYPEKTQEMINDGALTHQEVKKAKNVWNDLPNYHNLEKTL